MTEITLDAGAIALFKDGQEQLKLRDASGRVVGYFLPVQNRSNEVIFGAKSPFPREEIERRLREGAATARPLNDILAEFEQKNSGQLQ